MCDACGGVCYVPRVCMIECMEECENDVRATPDARAGQNQKPNWRKRKNETRKRTGLFHARMKRDPTPPTLGPPSSQPCWLRQGTHCLPFRPVVSARIWTFAAESRTSGPCSSRVCTRVLLPFDTSRWLPCANICRPNTTLSTFPVP
jgi:hypothetical protein